MTRRRSIELKSNLEKSRTEKAQMLAQMKVRLPAWIVSEIRRNKTLGLQA